ncbi:MAG: hypothetical protein H7X88_09200 [Gloeobacteraceae cyanobacterium ES-bin-316]|nr:hypothetical protein [Ferruginibacter sp.]
MLKATCLSILLAIVLYGFATAQGGPTDSLIRLLNKSSEDTNKVHLYWKTGVSLINQDAPAAVPYFKEGAALATKLGFISGMERCNNATSLAFSYHGKYDSALVYINYAVPYAIKAGNIKRLALAYLNRADVYTNLQNFSAALKDCDTAITYAERENNKDGLGRIHSIMSDIHATLKQYPQAIASLEKSNQFFEQVNNRQMIAMNYSEKAEIFIALNETDKAIPYFTKAIYIADSLGDIENLSAYNGGLAEAYAKVKNFSAAEAAAKLGLKYARQTGDVKQEAVMYDNLCNQQMLQNNFTSATEYGLKAYTIFKAEKDLLREQVIASTLAEAFYKSGNTAAAYEYLRISSDLNDSLVRQQFSGETARLQTAFEVKQKDKEIELLNKNKELQKQRLQKQQLLMLGALLLAVLAVLGIGLLMNRNKLRQRMKELELRNQIAADLHDEVGSSLSSIHMLSQMATRQQGTDEKHNEILARMGTNAKETMDRMGDIVWMIKPGETEADSLKQRMERFAVEMGSSKNIEVKIQLDDLETVRLNMEQRKNIYLIFKEGLNNAVKYSGAEKIEISTSLQGNKIFLQIKDFGRGFDKTLIRNGNGLDNMHHRAEDLNAVLDISSVINQGTSLLLKVPI